MASQMASQMSQVHQYGSAMPSFQGSMMAPGMAQSGYAPSAAVRFLLSCWMVWSGAESNAALPLLALPAMHACSSSHCRTSLSMRVCSTAYASRARRGRGVCADSWDTCADTVRERQQLLPQLVHA
jgi:hypothetical protein